MSRKSIVPEYPCTQDNYYCKTYSNIPHRVIYGTCQNPAPNGGLCKACTANPKSPCYHKLKSNCVDSIKGEKNDR